MELLSNIYQIFGIVLSIGNCDIEYSSLLILITYIFVLFFIFKAKILSIPKISMVGQAHPASVIVENILDVVRIIKRSLRSAGW